MPDKPQKTIGATDTPLPQTQYTAETKRSQAYAKIDALPIMKQYKDAKGEQIPWIKLPMETQFEIAKQSADAADIVLQYLDDDLRALDEIRLIQHLKTLIESHHKVAYKFLMREYKDAQSLIAEKEAKYMPKVLRGKEDIYHGLYSAIFQHERILMLLMTSKEMYNDSTPIFSRMPCYGNYVRIELIARFVSTAEYFLDFGTQHDPRPQEPNMEELEALCTSDQKVAIQIFKHPNMIKSLEQQAEVNSWKLRGLGINHKHVAEWLLSHPKIVKKMPAEHITAIKQAHPKPASATISYFNSLRRWLNSSPEATTSKETQQKSQAPGSGAKKG